MNILLLYENFEPLFCFARFLFRFCIGFVRAVSLFFLFGLFKLISRIFELCFYFLMILYQPLIFVAYKLPELTISLSM